MEKVRKYLKITINNKNNRKIIILTTWLYNSGELFGSTKFEL